MGLYKRYGDNLVIIEGEAKGVDSMARDAAEELGIEVDKYRADWKGKGRAAGPIRNREMLEHGKPHVVIAIGSGTGTNGCCRLAQSMGIPVVRRYYLNESLSK
jgi:hypothetical protein